MATSLKKVDAVQSGHGESSPLTLTRHPGELYLSKPGGLNMKGFQGQRTQLPEPHEGLANSWGELLSKARLYCFPWFLTGWRWHSPSEMGMPPQTLDLKTMTLNFEP